MRIRFSESRSDSVSTQPSRTFASVGSRPYRKGQPTREIVARRWNHARKGAANPQRFNRELTHANNRHRNTFRVHVHADIFGAGHKWRSSSGAVELALKTLLHQGRPFILRRLF